MSSPTAINQRSEVLGTSKRERDSVGSKEPGWANAMDAHKALALRPYIACSQGRLYVVDAEVIESIRAKHETLPWPLNEQMTNDEVTKTVLQTRNRRKK